MKITRNNLQEIIDLVLTTPKVLEDYCYYDGCPTNWVRGTVDRRKNGDSLSYHCEECGTKRHYNITHLKAIYQTINEKGGAT